jgi:hypothetical protein
MTLILYHLIIEQIMFQKYIYFLLLVLAIWRWNSDRGNSIFVSTFCGAWSICSCHTRVPDFRWPMKNSDFSACLAYIVYNWEVNSRDDNKQLVMEKKNVVVVTIMALGSNILHIFYPWYIKSSRRQSKV